MTDQPNSWQRQLLDILESRAPMLPADEVLDLAEVYIERCDSQRQRLSPAEVLIALDQLSDELSSWAMRLEELEDDLADAFAMGSARRGRSNSRAHLIRALRDGRSDIWAAQQIMREPKRGRTPSQKVWLVEQLIPIVERASGSATTSKDDPLSIAVSAILGTAVTDLPGLLRRSIKSRRV